MIINNCISQNCLSNLIGIKEGCTVDCDKPYFIEDIEGVDLTFLANTANPKTLSGIAYAKSLIETAARLMLGDIETLVGGGSSLVEGFPETCSTCTYTGSLQPGGGVIISNLTGSKFSVLKVTKVDVNCNGTGTQNLVFNDGVSIKKFAFIAGGVNTVTPILINYETTEKEVKVYIEDTAVKVAAIDCAKASGCGCSGSSSTPSGTSINYSGYLSGMKVSQL